jgi:hypothetical protein
MLGAAQCTVLGNIFRPQKQDVTRDGRRSHNEE